MPPHYPTMLYGLLCLFAALSLGVAATILVPPVAKPHILLPQGVAVMFAVIAIGAVIILSAVAQ